MDYLEDFKSAFRTTDIYKRMKLANLPDLRIFAVDLVRPIEVDPSQASRIFREIPVQDAYKIWKEATCRAATLVREATQLPRDARHPVRDHVVILGEEIVGRMCE